MTHMTPALADELESALDKVVTDLSNVGDEEWELLLHATGKHLDVLTTVADDLRRHTVGEAITQVVNRNVSSGAFRSKPSTGGGEFGLNDLGDIVTDAWALGATEVCIQGTVHPSEDAESYIDIARAVKRSAPHMHLHAFRPADIADFADRSQLSVAEAITELRAAGVDTFPGTGVKILNERVRAAVAPGDVDTRRWREIITELHRAGARTTSVIFYGHVETARERIAHLRVIADIQGEAGGFTEFVPIALPGYGVPLVSGRSPLDEHRAMFAVSRLLLSGSVRHIQVPWTRLGLGDNATLLRSGADDLGGTLMDGRVLPAVGVEQGLELPLTAARDIARQLGRPFRQRATDYTDLQEVSQT